MLFEWDPAKDRLNLAKHKISFDAARLVFDDPHALSVRDRTVEGEARWQTLGLGGGVALILVAHTYRDEGSEEVIRIISARKATRVERKRYEKGGQ